MKNHRSTKSGRPKPVADRGMEQWASVWRHHKVSQLLQFVHHTAGPFALTLFSADLKTVFVVWRTCLQHRVNQRQQFASQRNRCTFSALPLFYPPVPTGEVQARSEERRVGKECRSEGTPSIRSQHVSTVL